MGRERRAGVASFCPQLLCGPLICRRGVEQLIGLFHFERRDLRVVLEAENLPPAGGFELARNNAAILTRLRVRSGPTLGFDDRLALALGPLVAAAGRDADGDCRDIRSSQMLPMGNIYRRPGGRATSPPPA